MQPKTIFIAGGTGHQGSAAARTLLKEGYMVKVLTRNAKSPAAKELAVLGAQVLEGNLDNPYSYREHLQNVDSVFCVLTYSRGAQKEIEQGTKFIDAAKEKNIGHFVYASVIGADEHTGIPHWESKDTIEERLRSSGLPYTIIRPASFYENFLFPEVQSRIKKGNLVSPVKKHVIQQFISAGDAGNIAAVALRNSSRFIGRTFSVARDEFDMQQVANLFSEALGRRIKYKHLPILITRLVMGKDNTTMFKWVNRNNVLFVRNIPAVKQEFPFLVSMKEWIGRHAHVFSGK